jgi:CSLREA domain-containing protein
MVRQASPALRVKAWLALPIALFAFFLSFTVLATPAHAADYVVNSTADTNVCNATTCTLRGALNLANTANDYGFDKITFSVTGTINLLSKLDDIQTNLLIEGPGANLLTIRRADTAPDFNVLLVYRDTSVPVFTTTIRSVTIANGKMPQNTPYEAGGGGVLSIYADVIIQSSVITGNQAWFGGGGVQNDFGNMVIEDSLISHNWAFGDTSRDVGKGGGVYFNGGRNVLNNSVVQFNRGNRGGGINTAGDRATDTVFISNTRIISNTALNSANAAFNRNSLGGGIGNGMPGRLFIDSTIISGNIAYGGGGMYSEGNVNGFITVTNVAFYNNTALRNPNAGCNTFNGHGGGYMKLPQGAGGSFYIYNATFAENRTQCNGGGMYSQGSLGVVMNSTFANNNAVNGGGFSTDGSTSLTLTNNIFAQNTATTNGPNFSGGIGGNFYSSSYNLVENTAGSSGWRATDIVEQPANLGVFRLNAPFPYYPLLPTSPALNGGTPGGCTSAAGNTTVTLTRDLRGLPRPSGSACDIGAVEMQAPVLDLNGATAGTGYSTTYTEDAPPVTLSDATLTLLSDSDNLTGATVKLVNPQDGAAETLNATTTGTNISASFAGDTLTLSGTDNVANYKTVLASVKYGNASQNPGTTARQVIFAPANEFATAADVPVNVTVVAVNDAPVVSATQTALTFNESISGTVAGLSLADVDAGNGQLTVVVTATNGVVAISPTAGVTGNTSGAALTLSGTLANLNTALGSLVYTGTQYYNGAATVQISLSDNGNTGTGGALSDSESLSLTVLSALIVTKNSDSADLTAGGFGSLSYALNAAADTNRPNRLITFAPSLITVTLQPNTTLPIVASGITLQGRCGANGAEVVLDGANNTTGLRLNGGVTLTGLRVKGFAAPQIVAMATSGKKYAFVCSHRVAISNEQRATLDSLFATFTSSK